MKIRPLFAWYDLWVGLYWDRKTRRLYVLPLPCIGVVFDFGQPVPAGGYCSRCLAPILSKPGPFWTCPLCAIHETQGPHP